MNALIVGLGSIGRRHLRVLRAVQPDADITVWRQHSKPGDGGADLRADATVYSLGEAIERRPAMAIIANPAPYHIETALELARHDVHLLVEKPFADRTEDVQKLIDVCKDRGLVLMVGYNLRFDDGLIAMRNAILAGRIGRVLSMRGEVGQYLPDWRPNNDYRTAVSARADLGGGAVFELSHELDYARWLFGVITSVSATVDRISDLDIDVEDTAEILVKFATGAVGSIHLDMVQRVPRRVCRTVGSEGALEWDGISGAVRLSRPGDDGGRELHASPPAERDVTYRRQLLHFLECIAGNQRASCSGEDGLRIVELGLAIKQSSREQRWVTLARPSA